MSSYVVVVKGKVLCSGLPGQDTVRCGDCHDARSRIERMWKRKPGLKEKFQQTAMSWDERRAFIVEAKELMGDDLEMLVEQTINKHKTTEREWSMSAECDWLDETGLKDRFKSRPDKVEKIMKCGRQMQCPVMECTLYGVPKYTSLDKDTTTEIAETTA